MFESGTPFRKAQKDEAERPFWISYADLMTALMILFLVVMCVALLTVTRKITDEEKKTLARDKEIGLLLDELEQNITACGKATVWKERYVIDFGPQANFEFRSHALTPDQQRYLRGCVPHILNVTQSELGKKW